LVTLAVAGLTVVEAAELIVRVVLLAEVVVGAAVVV